MNLNLFIAKKIKGKSGEKGKLSSSSNTIACISVAISILVMFIAMVISDGFKREIRETSVGFSGEVFIIAPGQDITNHLYPISGRPSYIDKVKGGKGIESVNEVAYAAGMLKSDESVQGILFKGVDSTYNLKFFEKYLVEGELPNFSTRSASTEILISKRLANLMKYNCGDKITAYFVGQSVRVRKFTISGLYDIQLDQMDKTLALVDIRQTRRLNGWEADQVSNIEMSLVEGADTRKVCNELERIILERPWDDDSVVISQIRYIYPSHLRLARPAQYECPYHSDSYDGGSRIQYDIGSPYYPVRKDLNDRSLEGTWHEDKRYLQDIYLQRLIHRRKRYDYWQCHCDSNSLAARYVPYHTT